MGGGWREPRRRLLGGGAGDPGLPMWGPEGVWTPGSRCVLGAAGGRAGSTCGEGPCTSGQGTHGSPKGRLGISSPGTDSIWTDSISSCLAGRVSLGGRRERGGLRSSLRGGVGSQLVLQLGVLCLGTCGAWSQAGGWSLPGAVSHPLRVYSSCCESLSLPPGHQDAWGSLLPVMWAQQVPYMGVQRRDSGMPGLLNTCGGTHALMGLLWQLGSSARLGRRPQPSLAREGGCAGGFVGHADCSPPLAACPSLSRPRLEACLDAASGFDPCFSPSLGRGGRWVPNLGWGLGAEGGPGPRLLGRDTPHAGSEGPETRKAALSHPVGW